MGLFIFWFNLLYLYILWGSNAKFWIIFSRNFSTDNYFSCLSGFRYFTYKDLDLNILIPTLKLRKMPSMLYFLEKYFLSHELEFRQKRWALVVTKSLHVIKWPEVSGACFHYVENSITLPSSGCVSDYKGIKNWKQKNTHQVSSAASHLFAVMTELSKNTVN